MTSRERRARRAFDLLGEPRLRAFLRAVRSDHPSIAVRIVNEHLDSGESLEDILFDEREHGFELSVTSTAPNTFHVEFGCVVAPLAGDGGEWDVEFDPAGTVVQVTTRGYWIS